MHKSMAILGAANAAVAIMLGAFLAHALRGKLNERMQEVFATAVDYHTWHALALILLALSAPYIQNQSLLTTSMWLMFAGIILFSGSLYVMVLTGVTQLGMITPIGGVSLIIAWILYAVALLK